MLLYLLDKMIDPEVTVKVMGSQWFWFYLACSFGIQFGVIPLSYLVT
jgi:hypothetical protein